MWLLCLSSLFHWSFLAVPDLVSVSRWAIQRNHKLLADFRCFIPAGDLNFFGGDASFHEPKRRGGMGCGSWWHCSASSCFPFFPKRSRSAFPLATHKARETRKPCKSKMAMSPIHQSSDLGEDLEFIASILKL